MSKKIKADASLGKNLRALRKKHGYTQEQLVAKLQLLNQDISRSIYAQIECGTYNIRVSELVALQQIYRVSFDAFFEGIDLD